RRPAPATDTRMAADRGGPAHPGPARAARGGAGPGCDGRGGGADRRTSRPARVAPVMVSDLRPATAESAAATTPAPGPARARRHHGAVAGYAFVLPGFILYAVIILYPAVRTFLMSLQDFNIAPGAVSTFIGLDNYVRAIQDPVLQQWFVSAAFYMVATVPAQIVLGLFVAVLVDSRVPGVAVYLVMCYVPAITSCIVAPLLLQSPYPPAPGVIHCVPLHATRLDAKNASWLGQRRSAMTALSLSGIWKRIGWSSLIFPAA